MKRLSARQRAVLAILADGSWWPPEDLAARVPTSREGAASTASSLVRRGLAERTLIRRRVHYGITAAGRHHQNGAA